MKIVQVTPRYPPNTGGVETHVKEISERLVERGHEVTVITADAGEDMSNKETRNGVNVERYKGFAPSGAFHIAPGITPAVRRVDGDVVHAHNYHSLPVFLAAIGLREERFIVTPHYHGGSENRFREGLLTLYQPFGRWAVRQANEVIAVSDWERDRIQDDFGITASVIPNGLDVDRFAKARPEERNRPYLLCVGRLEKYKGVQYVIRALPHLSEYDLVVAGSGPYRDDLEQIAQDAGVANRVEFLGFVDDKRLQGLYAGAEVYVTLSEFEAYGITVGEALAAGTPCVIRDTAGLSDWAKQEGCVAVNQIASNPVANAVRESQGRPVDIRQLPSWPEVVNGILDIYQA